LFLKSCQSLHEYELISALCLQGGKSFMKQQGFHIADRTHHAKRRDDPLPGSSQTSSKLADGLQGLMDMCNAGSLMTAPVQAMVCIASNVSCTVNNPEI